MTDTTTTKVPRTESDITPYDEQTNNEHIKLFEPIPVPPWDFTPPFVRVAEHLVQNNFCVLDNFYGQENTLELRNEIISYQEKGLMKDGEIGKGKLATSRGVVKTMRSDKIVWFEGSEPVCPLLRRYILYLDVFSHKLCRFLQGCFSKETDWVHGGRSKAMATVYPPGGTHYVPHYDNPNKDGRRLTCVFYLNPDWKEGAGGTLRVKTSGKTVDVAPLCDRLALFWSDRRCPHEVMPSNQNRYAVTVWFFDDRERLQAMTATS
eukprot:PhM_4_TR3724/c0_g1_i1/m.87346/K09592/EGLN, HPH; hypoxia-inducible factor prolyl hydroxylase